MNLDFYENRNNNFKSNFSKDLENHISKTNLSFSIDRFEGNFAVCENLQTHEMINIEKSLIPKNCKTGDIIVFADGKYILDENQTKKEKEEIKNLVNNLFKRKN